MLTGTAWRTSKRSKGGGGVCIDVWPWRRLGRWKHDVCRAPKQIDCCSATFLLSDAQITGDRGGVSIIPLILGRSDPGRHCTARYDMFKHFQMIESLNWALNQTTMSVFSTWFTVCNRVPTYASLFLSPFYLYVVYICLHFTYEYVIFLVYLLQNLCLLLMVHVHLLLEIFISMVLNTFMDVIEL